MPLLLLCSMLYIIVNPSLLILVVDMKLILIFLLSMSSTKESKTADNTCETRQETGRQPGARAVHPRPGTAGQPENWHGLVVRGGTTVPPSTAWSCGVARPCRLARPSHAGAARVCRFRDFRLFICVFPSFLGHLSSTFWRVFLR